MATAGACGSMIHTFAANFMAELHNPWHMWLNGILMGYLFSDVIGALARLIKIFIFRPLILLAILLYLWFTEKKQDAERKS